VADRHILEADGASGEEGTEEEQLFHDLKRNGCQALKRRKKKRRAGLEVRVCCRFSFGKDRPGCPGATCVPA
jgi:hypothetical protein